MRLNKSILHTRFRDTFRRLLAQSKLTQNKFATSIDMQFGDVSRMLKGDHMPRLDMVERIAAGFGVDPGIFFQEEM